MEEYYMGYAGKLDQREQATRLRRRGYSYNEIRKRVPVSKDSLSRWCRDIILSPKQLEILHKKKLSGAERGRIIGAKIQQEIRIEKTKEVVDKAIDDIGSLSKRDLFIAGLTLYLGDGYKKDVSVGFSNSNPAIIKFMMRWFRESCFVSDEKFRGQIWIHDNLDEAKAKIYWSKVTGIPLKYFNKSYIAKNKTDSKKIRKNVNMHGVISIRIYDSWLQRKIMGWASGVLGTRLI